ncbi:hypothetical protein WH47_10315 [Habropoda laboriosa]|uniref:Uncharacterized protein n=1 Tax=Habropoda laboriosa TaxID=597456 RepID=A0A0L7R4T8_9HYME|nr:hypothetical protein WH47_10315 [Habropoda laboriosa]
MQGWLIFQIKNLPSCAFLKTEMNGRKGKSPIISEEANMLESAQSDLRMVSGFLMTMLGSSDYRLTIREKKEHQVDSTLLFRMSEWDSSFQPSGSFLHQTLAKFFYYLYEDESFFSSLPSKWNVSVLTDPKDQLMLSMSLPEVGITHSVGEIVEKLTRIKKPTQQNKNYHKGFSKINRA